MTEAYKDRRKLRHDTAAELVRIMEAKHFGRSRRNIRRLAKVKMLASAEVKPIKA